MNAALLLLALGSAHAGPADGIEALTWARPFTVQTPERWTLRADTPDLLAGWVLELRVDPERAGPHQGLAPVLTVGDWPVMRANYDPVGGCALVVVPEAVDLSMTPVFWAGTELPGRVDAAGAEAARQTAAARGDGPFSGAEIAAAVTAGGGPLAADDLAAVFRVLADRIALCSPEERQRVETYRIP